MAKRADILANLPGTPPIAITEREAAALCAMSVEAFKKLCPIPGAERGRSICYPYDEVKAWYRKWWLAETSRADNDPGPENWVKRFEDDQDAA